MKNPQDAAHVNQFSVTCGCDQRELVQITITNYYCPELLFAFHTHYFLPITRTTWRSHGGHRRDRRMGEGEEGRERVEDWRGGEGWKRGEGEDGKGKRRGGGRVGTYLDIEHNECGWRSMFLTHGSQLRLQ